MAGNLGRSDAFSEQRRGSATVDASHFKSCAGMDTRVMEGSSKDISILCLSLWEDPADFSNLISSINLKLVKENLCFDESCEDIFSLLYFALLWKVNYKQNITVCLLNFTHRWFGLCDGEFMEITNNLSHYHKISSLGSVLLLHNHIFYSQTSFDYSTILDWKYNSKSLPTCFREYIPTPYNDTYYSLNIILVKSLNLSKTIQIENLEYIEPLYLFFNACHYYSLQNYDECLKILNSIEEKNCSTFLMGMINLFSGLNLSYCGKIQSALIKFKLSLNCSTKCWMSIYFAAKLFRKNNSEACLEMLQLLNTVNPEDELKDLTFQGMLLDFHFPTVTHFHQRTSWLLANKLLRHQKCTEARRIYSNLYTSYPVTRQLNSTPPSRFRECDQLPLLPEFICIKMEYALTLARLKEFNEIESIFKDLNDDFSLVGTNESTELLLFSLAASLLLSAEASYYLNKLDISMDKCVKLMLTFETAKVLPAGVWINIYQLLKFRLYDLLAILANERNQKDNNAYFKRLRQLCMDAWLAHDCLSIESFSENSKWIVQNVIDYFKEFVNVNEMST